MEMELDKPKPKSQPVQWDGLLIGVFTLAAGSLLMAERVGLIAKDISWGFPTVLIVFGAVTLVRNFQQK
jgi:hypothetical protein